MDSTFIPRFSSIAPPIPPPTSTLSVSTELLAVPSDGELVDPFQSLLPLNSHLSASSSTFSHSFLPSSSPLHSFSTLNCDLPSLNLNSSLPPFCESEIGVNFNLDHSLYLDPSVDLPSTPTFPSRESSRTSVSESSLSPGSDTSSPTLSPPNSVVSDELLAVHAFAEDYSLPVENLLEDSMQSHSTMALSKQEAQPTMATALTPKYSQTALSATVLASNSSAAAPASSAACAASSMNATPTVSHGKKNKKRSAPPEEEDHCAVSPKSECSAEDEKESKKSCLPRGLLYHVDSHVHDRPPNKFLEFCPAHRAWTTLDYEGIFYIGLSTKVNGAHITALKSETLKSGITWRQPFNVLPASVAAKGYTLFVLGVGSRLRPAYVAKLRGKIRFEQSQPSEARCRRCRLKAEVLEWTLMENGDDRETTRYNQEMENILGGKVTNTTSRAKKQRTERVNALIDESEENTEVTVSEELLAFHARLQLSHPPAATSSSSSPTASQQLMTFDEYYHRLLKLFLMFHVYAHGSSPTLTTFSTALHLEDCDDQPQIFMRLGRAIQQLQLQGRSMYESWQHMRSFDLLAEMIQQHFRLNGVSFEQLRLYERQAVFILRESPQRVPCSNWLGGCYHRLAVDGSQLCSDCAVQYQQQQPAAQQRLPAIFLFATNVQSDDAILWQQLWNSEQQRQLAVFAYNATNNVWMRRWQASECDANELLMITFNPMSAMNSSAFDRCSPVYGLVDIALHAVNVMNSTSQANGILAAVERSERKLISAADFQSLARTQQFYVLSSRPAAASHRSHRSQHTNVPPQTSASFNSQSSMQESGQHMAIVTADTGGSGGIDGLNGEVRLIPTRRPQSLQQPDGIQPPIPQPFTQGHASGLAVAGDQSLDSPHPFQAIEVFAPHGQALAAPIRFQHSSHTLHSAHAHSHATQPSAQNTPSYDPQRSRLSSQQTSQEDSQRYYEQMESMLAAARQTAESAADPNGTHSADATHSATDGPSLHSSEPQHENQFVASVLQEWPADNSQLQSSQFTAGGATSRIAELEAPQVPLLNPPGFSPWSQLHSHAHAQSTVEASNISRQSSSEEHASQQSTAMEQSESLLQSRDPQPQLLQQLQQPQSVSLSASESASAVSSDSMQVQSLADLAQLRNVVLSDAHLHLPRGQAPPVSARQMSSEAFVQGHRRVGQGSAERENRQRIAAAEFTNTSAVGVNPGGALAQLALLTSWFSSKAEQSLALLVVLFSASLAQQQAAAPAHHQPFQPLSPSQAAVLQSCPPSQAAQSHSSSQADSCQNFQSSQSDSDQTIRFIRSSGSSGSWLSDERFHGEGGNGIFYAQNQHINGNNTFRTNSAVAQLAAAVSWFTSQAKQSAALFVVFLSVAKQSSIQQQQQQAQTQRWNPPVVDLPANSTPQSSQTGEQHSKSTSQHSDTQFEISSKKILGQFIHVPSGHKAHFMQQARNGSNAFTEETATSSAKSFAQSSVRSKSTDGAEVARLAERLLSLLRLSLKKVHQNTPAVKDEEYCALDEADPDEMDSRQSSAATAAAECSSKCCACAVAA